MCPGGTGRYLSLEPWPYGFLVAPEEDTLSESAPLFRPVHIHIDWSLPVQACAYIYSLSCEWPV